MIITVGVTGGVFMTNGQDADLPRPNEVIRAPVRVFISYAHDDPAHEDRVRHFWRFLRAMGIDAHADMQDGEGRRDWTEWMTEQVYEADHVLVIASPAYKRYTDSNASSDEGRGVRWEDRAIRHRVYSDQEAGLQIVIPVVLPGCVPGDIPRWLGPTATTHYRVTEYTRAGAEDLLRLLTGQPREPEQPLGASLVLPPLDPGYAAHAADSPLSDDLTTSAEFREDLVTLLGHLDARARRGRLPRHLPEGADVISMSRTVRVRQGIRARLAGGSPEEDGPQPRDIIATWLPKLAGGGSAEEAGPRSPNIIATWLPKTDRERPQEPVPARPWPEVAAEYRRLMVLADPGLGKSWLIRAETHRQCDEALASLDDDPDGVIVPLPLRCDQLFAASGSDLADKAVSFLVAQQLLPERSRARLAAKVRAGRVVLLLDAFDELTGAERERLREIVRAWADLAGDDARCVITSRIAGYTGSPVPDAHEVELQPFTTDDIAGVVDGWHLPAAAASELQGRAADPAIAAMSRIPLMLSFLCSVAGESAKPNAGEVLPRTRGELFDRVLRWFLTREHRSPENFAAPALDNVGVEELLQILGPLAFTFATQPAGWTDLMPADRLLAAIGALPTVGDHRKAAEVLRVLTVDAGILVPEGDPSAGRNPGYLFTHRAVAEYLVAYHLATLPERERLAIVEQHRWFDPDWAEVIPMLGERLGRAAATLIEYLLATETDPFHHTLFTVIRIWGACLDADHLLPTERAEELAARIVDLFSHERARTAVSSKLAAMVYLPQLLETRLLGRLTDDDESVRVTAVQALAGRDIPRVTEALLGRLADGRESVRAAAVAALAGHDTPAVTGGLLDRLTGGPWYARHAAVTALAGHDTPEVTQRLLGQLTDRDWRVKIATAAALAGRATPAVTQGLLGLLADRDRPVKVAAMTALAGHDTPEVTQRLLGELTGQHESVRIAAVKALSGRDTPEVTRRLLNLLADRDRPVKVAAMTALAGHDTPEVTKGLLAQLKDEHRSVRATAVTALADCGAPGVTKALLSSLGDLSPEVKIAAVATLAVRDTPEVIQGLLRRAGALTQFTRAPAVAALIWRDTPEVTRALLDRLDDKARMVRATAVAALIWRDTPEVTRALLAKLDDPSRVVRCLAVAALAARTTPQITQDLLELFGDPVWAMRIAAIMTCRDVPEVTPALLKRLADPAPLVRELAEVAVAERDDPQVLMHLAGETRKLMNRAEGTGPVTDPPLIGEAEKLMTRFYRRIEPSERPAVLSEMGWLTQLRW